MLAVIMMDLVVLLLVLSVAHQNVVVQGVFLLGDVLPISECCSDEF